MQRIWQWRHGVGDELEPWTATAAISAFRGSQLRGFRTLGPSHPRHRQGDDRLPCTRARRVGSRVAQGQVPPLLRRRSRGKPGPGGAGAVIVRVDEYGGPCRRLQSAAASHTTEGVGSGLPIPVSTKLCRHPGRSVPCPPSCVAATRAGDLGGYCRVAICSSRSDQSMVCLASHRLPRWQLLSHPVHVGASLLGHRLLSQLLRSPSPRAP